MRGAAAGLPAGEAEAVWELFATSAGPVRKLAESLEPERREALHRAFVELVAAHAVDGGIRFPREYLLVLGRRRGER